MDIKLLNVTKTTAEWADVVVAATVISKGLLCIELDTNGKSWAKVGDGVHTYSQLPYITDGAVASLGNIFTIKGVVATYEDLPASGNHAGDVYFVGDSTQTGSDIFEEYVWTTGSKWEFIGKTGEVVIPAYTGGTGISVVDGVDSKVINHTNSITAGTASGSATGTLAFGGTFDIPTVTYDAQGHITAKGTTTMTMPANPNTDTTYTLSGAYGSGNATWVTTLTPSSGNATTSTVPTASTSVYGITTLTDSTSSTSTTTAATPNSVKSAYDLASGKSVVSVSGLSSTGTSIGTITVNGTANSVKVPLTSLTSSSETSTIDLAANTKYALNAGGSSVIFKTPTDTTYEFADSYNASTNKGATVATVTNAIAALDGNLNSTTPGAGKTLTAFSQTDGVVSATFDNISITKSQISDFPTNITNVVNNLTYGLRSGSTVVRDVVMNRDGVDSTLLSVTDNTSATDITSSDTNLITARTLYYAGYVHEDDSLTLNCTL